MADAPAKVLIADDNEQNCDLILAYLGKEGYDLRTAEDGEATIAAVEEWSPDLLLLDIMMPRMSGFEVCERLKSSDATKDMPILVVTALGDIGDIERAVTAGCDDFVSKPVDRVELQIRVRSLLRVRMLQNERDRLLAYIEEVTGEKPRLPGD